MFTFTPQQLGGQGFPHIPNQYQLVNQLGKLTYWGGTKSLIPLKLSKLSKWKKLAGYGRQCRQISRFEWNMPTNGSTIGADMHTCPPLSNQPLFRFYPLYTSIFLYIFTSMRVNAFYVVYRHTLHSFLYSIWIQSPANGIKNISEIDLKISHTCISLPN